MLIAISKINVKKGHFEKVLPLLKENAAIGLSQKGCREGYISKNIENSDELLIYTLWNNQTEYEEARKRIKKDSGFQKLSFRLLPHLAKQPEINAYEIIPFD